MYDSETTHIVQRTLFVVHSKGKHSSVASALMPAPANEMLFPTLSIADFRTRFYNECWGTGGAYCVFSLIIVVGITRVLMQP